MASKVWLDKQLMQETYGAYQDQKFKSLHYTGGWSDEIADFSAKVREFQAWCKESYQLLSQGIDPGQPPEFVMHLPTTLRKRDRIRVQARSKEAIASKREAQQGDDPTEG